MEQSEQQPLQQPWAQQPRLLETSRRVKASQGMAWISQAWKIYRRNKIKWPVMLLVFLFISMLAQWLGQVLLILYLYVGISSLQQSNTNFSILFLPVAPLLLGLGAWINMLFSGGIMYACNRSAIYGELKFNHLFAAFATKKKAFFIFLLLYLAAGIVAGIAVIPFMAVFESGIITESSPTASYLILLIAAVLIIFFISLWMSIWFAPCLIMLHDVKPWAAMKMSFTACLRNISAGIVNFLMWIAIYICLIIGICIIAGLAIGVFALLFGKTVPDFAATGAVSSIIIFYIVMILSALILAALVIINIYAGYRNILTDLPLEN